MKHPAPFAIRRDVDDQLTWRVLRWCPNSGWDDYGVCFRAPSWPSAVEALRIHLLGHPWSDIRPSTNGLGARIEGYP